MDQKQLSEYFDRIGYHPTECTLETLELIILHHISTIPYETLDIHYATKCSIDMPELHDKLVIRKRGGYCLEMNNLLFYVLETMGFKVTKYLARMNDSGIVEDIVNS